MFTKSRAAPLPLWAIAGLQLVLGSVQAQAHAQAQATAPASPPPASTRPDPADPKAPVPAALYASPLRAYQGFAEPQVAPWRETNERVRQRGAASQPAPAAEPASGGHAGHRMK